MSRNQVTKSARHRTRHDLNSEATRATINRVAHRLFAKKGYAGTSLNEIVAAANVTTGAVYHHYGDKGGLFRAVVEALESTMMARLIEKAAQETDPWKRLERGIDAMLEASLAPDVQRILFTDAPNVFGQAEWREIEKRYGYGALIETLNQLKAAGRLRANSVEVLAPILLGALVEAAGAIALAKNQQAALADARDALGAMLSSLRA
jgi:AcrR family transcriptional regulator